MSEPRHIARCNCGAVQVVARAEPKRVGLCHCKTCQRETGAPFNCFVVFDRKDVTVTGGPLRGWASSPGETRWFCETCGSPVYYGGEGSGEMEIYLGLLEEPERLRPQYEAWVFRRAPWLARLPGIPQYERNRT